MCPIAADAAAANPHGPADPAATHPCPRGRERAARARPPTRTEAGHAHRPRAVARRARQRARTPRPVHPEPNGNLGSGQQPAVRRPLLEQLHHPNRDRLDQRRARRSSHTLPSETANRRLMFMGLPRVRCWCGRGGPRRLHLSRPPSPYGEVPLEACCATRAMRPWQPPRIRLGTRADLCPNPPISAPNRPLSGARVPGGEGPGRRMVADIPAPLGCVVCSPYTQVAAGSSPAPPITTCINTSNRLEACVGTAMGCRRSRARGTTGDHDQGARAARLAGSLGDEDCVGSPRRKEDLRATCRHDNRRTPEQDFGPEGARRESARAVSSSTRRVRPGMTSWSASARRR